MLRARWWWTTFFVAFFLLGAAWSVATPYEGVPDEDNHVIRAAGVWYGGFFPHPTAAVNTTGAYQPVPRGSVTGLNWPMHPDATANNITRQPSADHHIIWFGSAAGRYHPLYYVLVGWPERFWAGWGALIVARLVSALIISALLAWAVTIAIRYTRHSVALAGVLVTVTPLVMHLAGGVNPSGLEISSAILMFTALIPLVTRAGPPPRALVHTAGFAAVVLAQSRTPGPLWLLLTGIGLAILTPWGRLKELGRDTAVRWWLPFAALSAILSAAWTVKFQASQVVPSGASFTFWEALKLMIFSRWLEYVTGAIGVLSWGDAPLPAPTYIVWLVAIGGLVAALLVVGDRRQRWAGVVLGVLGFLVPSIVQAITAHRDGIVMQGRYLLPMLASVPILAGYALNLSPIPDRYARTIVRTAAVLLVPVHVFALEYALSRWTHGLVTTGSTPTMRLNITWGPWHPVAGLVPPFTLMILGSAALLAAVWWAARQTWAPPTAPGANQRPSAIPSPRQTVERDAPVGAPAAT